MTARKLSVDKDSACGFCFVFISDAVIEMRLRVNVVILKPNTINYSNTLYHNRLGICRIVFGENNLCRYSLFLGSELATRLESEDRGTKNVAMIWRGHDHIFGSAGWILAAPSL